MSKTDIDTSDFGTFLDEDYKTSSRIEDGDLPVARTDFELDQALIGSSAKQGAIIEGPEIGYDFPLGAQGVCKKAGGRPCMAYLHYVPPKIYIPGGTTNTHEFKKKKGFSKQWTASTEVKASVGGAIKIIDFSAEVTAGYSYSETTTEETEETFSQEVRGPNDYWTYQIVLLYYIRTPCNMQSANYFKSQNTPYKFRQSKDGGFEQFAVVPAFRDGPFVTDIEIVPLSLNAAIDYWWSDFRKRHPAT